MRVELLELVALAVGAEGEVGAAGGVFLRHFDGRRRRVAPQAEGRAAGAAAALAFVLVDVLSAQLAGLEQVCIVAALRLAAVQMHQQVVRERLVAAHDLHGVRILIICKSIGRG